MNLGQLQVSVSLHGQSQSVFLLLCISASSLITVSGLAAVDFNLMEADTTATLGCVKDSPNDDLRWVRDGLNITNSSKYEVATDAYMSNLTVKNAGEGDIGIYLCINQSNIDINVTLFAKPFNDTTIGKSVSLIEGETGVLKCSGWGWPKPTLSWTREKPVYWDHVFGINDANVQFGVTITPYNVTNDNGQLSLKEMKQGDQMYYLCRLSNKLGNATVTIYVRVKDRLAAVWPFIGIIVELIILVIFIIVFEVRRRRKQALEEAEFSKSK